MYDIVIIGGGQSALACGYFLQRTALNYIILDDQPLGGGAWLHGWDSLTLFSPAEYSSLPGWMMPKSEHKFPAKNEVIAYLQAYEQRYKLRIQRPVTVQKITRSNDEFNIETSAGIFQSKVVISATGTWKHPFIPQTYGRNTFNGKQLHSAQYQNADDFLGKKVLIVGAGNSGAQILAEVSKVALTTWAVQHEPEYLPDEVDGRVLFDVASAKYHSLQSGGSVDAKPYNLGNIVMVPPVVEARARGVLKSRPMFELLTASGVKWMDGTEEAFDVIIWCTGFRPATDHLKSLNIIDEFGKTATAETKSNSVPGLFMVGYGNWTGFASATLIGVGRSARQTIKAVEEYLNE